MPDALQPYTGPEAACPKCRVAGKCSTGHHPKPDRFCAKGFNCPAKWSVKEEHFLRHCINCDYEWIEGMPVDKPAEQPSQDARRRVELGVVEFHSESFSPGLIDRFYAVTNDLEAAACTVDLWLLDISRVLAEFGYEMEVYTNKPLFGEGVA